MKFNIILADPPWSYRVWSEKGKARSAENHYPTMKLNEIKALPVKELAAPDCALFLWVTAPNLLEGIETLKAWGFTFKTIAFVWCKVNKKQNTFFMGNGYWTRANAELVLLGTRGTPTRLDKGVRQLCISRIGDHSEKPKEIHSRIERLMGDLPRVELFGREEVDGWIVLGNEIDGRDIRESLPALIDQKEFEI